MEYSAVRERMTDFFNKEIVETNLPKHQPDLTASSLSDHELKQVSSKPLSPPQSLDSSWIISIREKLNQARQYEASSPWQTLSIYRVPKSLRKSDETAYTPQIVSLGPYHRGLQQLQDMEPHKWRALHHAIHRTGQDVRLYLDAARSLEDRARACYEGPLSISSDAFVESLVLDSIFAIEVFRGADKGFEDLGYPPDDPVFSDRGIILKLHLDMIMLENQLPLFVLDRILALQLGHEPSSSGLMASLALHFFDNFWPSKELLPEVGSSEALHCLDVFRRSLLLAGPKPTFRRRIHWPRIQWRGSHASHIADKWPLQFVHCVAELRDADIEFRCIESDRFWDIQFKDGVLHIPRIVIQDGTKSIFLNLIAFEQCHPKCSNHITSYIVFMDNLINSEVDVRYLHSKGIIEHWLGNDGEVADLFNRLGQEVYLDIDDYYFLELSKQVNRYYNNKCNVWRASFNHKYFSNPWAFISLVAAVVLLLLTSTQTFYSVYGYYKPKK